MQNNNHFENFRNDELFWEETHWEENPNVVCM